MSVKYKLATSSWDHKEIEAIQSVIESDSYTMGKYVFQFETLFAKFIDRKYAVMVSSGSAANLIATAALFFTGNKKLKRGDEVIVPAVSWSTTYFPLQQYGLKLKFVDIDLETLNYDLGALRSAVSSKTKLLVIVNLLGNPNNFEEIDKIVKDKDMHVLEDNCESMGAIYQERQAGTYGDLSTFSSFFSHHIATMEGGIVATDDKELYHILLSMRAHGWTRDLPEDNELIQKNKDKFFESFRFLLPGYNVRPVEMSGAIGIEQLKKLPKFVGQRRENAKLFVDIFSGHEQFMIQKEIGESSWFGFSLIIKPSSNLKRNDVVKKLQDAGIDCRPIVSGNFTRNEVMQYFDYSIFGTLDNADYLHDNGFFVGNSHVDLTKELDFLSKILSTE